MRPVLFEYAYTQKPDSFKEVIYDYKDDINKIQGKSVVERAHLSTIYCTKTNVQRESDDTSNEDLMAMVTKTNTQREVDDSPYDELVLAATKTLVERESDDDAIDPYVMLLTKTEVARETDE